MSTNQKNEVIGLQYKYRKVSCTTVHITPALQYSSTGVFQYSSTCKSAVFWSIPTANPSDRNPNPRHTKRADQKLEEKSSLRPEKYYNIVSSLAILVSFFPSLHCSFFIQVHIRHVIFSQVLVVVHQAGGRQHARQSLSLDESCLCVAHHNATPWQQSSY